MIWGHQRQNFPCQPVLGAHQITALGLRDSACSFALVPDALAVPHRRTPIEEIRAGSLRVPFLQAAPKLEDFLTMHPRERFAREMSKVTPSFRSILTTAKQPLKKPTSILDTTPNACT